MFNSASSALLALGGAATFALAMATPATAVTISGTNTTDGFSDGDTSVLTRDITFTAADFAAAGATGIIEDINLDVFFAKSNDNSFVPETDPITSGTPYFDEIFFSITSPSGTSVTLINNPTIGSTSSFNVGSNGFKGIITFDQDAAVPVNADRDNITAGTFQPATDGGNLDAFNGESAIGTWVFAFNDDIGLDGLSFYETTLNVQAQAQPVPFELETGVSLVALAGVFGLRKLRQRKVKV